jgi:hypothetical protein
VGKEREENTLRQLFTPARQFMLGSTVIVLLLAFWLSPRLGLLTLGVIVFLGVLYGIYCLHWFFGAHKEEKSS